MTDVFKLVRRFFDEGNFSFAYFLGRNSTDERVRDIVGKALALSGSYHKAKKYISDPDFSRTLDRWEKKLENPSDENLNIVVISKKLPLDFGLCQFTPASYFEHKVMGCRTLTVALLENPDAEFPQEPRSFRELEKLFEEKNFEPDLIIFHEPEYWHIEGIEKCPFPLVAISVDFDYSLHSSVEKLKMFDIVVVMGGISHMLLGKWGIKNVITMGGWQGYLPEMFESAGITSPPAQKDIDFFFSGSVADHVRLRILNLARELSGFNIFVKDSPFESNREYVRYLARSKATFSNHRRGEMQLRITESLYFGTFTLVSSAPFIKIDGFTIVPNETELFYDKGVEFFQLAEFRTKLKSILGRWDELYPDVLEVSRFVKKHMTAYKNFKKLINTLTFLRDRIETSRRERAEGKRKAVIPLALSGFTTVQDQAIVRMKKEQDIILSGICDIKYSLITSEQGKKKELFYDGIQKLREAVEDDPENFQALLSLSLPLVFERSIVGFRTVTPNEVIALLSQTLRALSRASELSKMHFVDSILQMNLPGFWFKYYSCLSDCSITDAEREERLQKFFFSLLAFLISLEFAELGDTDGALEWAFLSLTSDAHFTPRNWNILQLISKIFARAGKYDEYFAFMGKVMDFVLIDDPSFFLLLKRYSEKDGAVGRAVVRKALRSLEAVGQNTDIIRAVKGLVENIEKTFDTNRKSATTNYIAHNEKPNAPGTFACIEGISNFKEAQSIIEASALLNPRFVLFSDDAGKFVVFSSDIAKSDTCITIKTANSGLKPNLHLTFKFVRESKDARLALKVLISTLKRYSELGLEKQFSDQFLQNIDAVLNVMSTFEGENPQDIYLYITCAIYLHEFVREGKLDAEKLEKVAEKLKKIYPAVFSLVRDNKFIEEKFPFIKDRNLFYRFFETDMPFALYDRVKLGRLIAHFTEANSFAEISRRIFDVGFRYSPVRYEFFKTLPERGLWDCTIYHSHTSPDTSTLSHLASITKKYVFVISPEPPHSLPTSLRPSKLTSKLQNYITFKKYSEILHIFELK